MARGGDMSVWQVTSDDELREAILETPRVALVGSRSRLAWVAARNGQQISTEGLTGILDFRPDDLVVTVRSGTQVTDLEQMIAESGLCLGLSRVARGWMGSRVGTIGGLIALNLPHASQNRTGAVKDWCLGMRVMRGNGDVVTFGSQVVKSVAGFDLHRTMAGSRGGLGAILSVSLRLYPRRLVETDELQVLGQEDPAWVSRVPVSRVDEVLNHLVHPVACLRSSGIIWSREAPTDLHEGWSIGPGGRTAPHGDHMVEKLRRSLKATLDPLGRFSEGFRS